MSESPGKMTLFQQEVERVHQILSNEIYSGQRLPHERLVENNLAEKYKVGRMVIRQVLSNLKTIGLVEIEPYKGATIAAVTIDRIRETYEIVAVLEGYSTKLTAERITDTQLQELSDVLVEQQQITNCKPTEWQSVNKKFHRIINRSCGNDKLIQLIRQHVQFTNFWFLVVAVSEFEQQFNEHQAIVKALKKRDPIEARKSMEHHIISICDFVVEHMQKNMPVGMFRKT